MSKTQRKIQFASNRGIGIGYTVFPKSMSAKTGWYVVDDRLFEATGFLNPDPDIHGPYLSKRAAKNDAYRLAVGQKPLYHGIK